MLYGAQLNDADLFRANFHGADLRGANLRGAKFSLDVSEDGTTNLDGVKWGDLATEVDTEKFEGATLEIDGKKHDLLDSLGAFKEMDRAKALGSHGGEAELTAYFQSVVADRAQQRNTTGKDLSAGK